jgi:UV DNA damage repair endonuclease
MARWMGYGQTFQDFKINVHISGKRGPAGIRAALKRLSPEARNCITIENDEMSWGVDASLELVNDCALVLDIHHHWIRTGEYIQPTDDRVLRLIDSWRGVRPVCHYSVSREDVLVNHAVDAIPNHTELLELGYKKQKMRAHSDWYWNQPVTDWALGFWENFDIMCESKAKNLSSAQVYNRAQELNLV